MLIKPLNKKIKYDYNGSKWYITVHIQVTHTKLDSYKSLHNTNNNSKIFCFLFENDDPFYKHFPFDDNTTTHIIKLSTSHTQKNSLVSLSKYLRENFIWTEM